MSKLGYPLSRTSWDDCILYTPRRAYFIRCFPYAIFDMGVGQWREIPRQFEGLDNSCTETIRYRRRVLTSIPQK